GDQRGDRHQQAARPSPQKAAAPPRRTRPLGRGLRRQIRGGLGLGIGRRRRRLTHDVSLTRPHWTTTRSRPASTEAPSATTTSLIVPALGEARSLSLIIAENTRGGCL